MLSYLKEPKYETRQIKNNETRMNDANSKIDKSMRTSISNYLFIIIHDSKELISFPIVSPRLRAFECTWHAHTNIEIIYIIQSS